MKCSVFRLPLAGAAGALISAWAILSPVEAAPSITAKHLTTDVQVSADGRFVELLHSEVHINNEAGALQEGQKAIPYVASMARVQVLSAYTLKKDGRKIPVAGSAVHDESLPGLPQMPLFSDQRMKVIVFPQLGPGDTAVYTARIQTIQPYFPSQFIFGDVFPKGVAFEDVRESIAAPARMALHVENHGVNFHTEKHGSSIVYRWQYAAPKPSPVDQPPAVSPLDHNPRFFVSSFRNYGDLGQAYAALAAPEETVTPKVRILAEQLTRGVKDRRAQAQRLYEWVAKHIRYVAIQLGRGSFVPHSAESVLANGYGDCKDHVALLAALLKAKGIASMSVLVNSGNAYTLSGVPTFFQLNHAITFLPEFNVFADSTAMVAPFGVLPLSEYGKPVVLAKLSGSTLSAIPVLPAGLSNVTMRTAARVDAKGQLIGTTETTASGPRSILLRLAGLGIQVLGPEAAAAKQLATLGYTGATGTFQMTPPTQLAATYSVKSSFAVPGWLEANADNFYIPGGLRLLGLSGDGLMGPIFSQTTSSSGPIACFSGHESEVLSLRLPAKYHLSRLPPDVSVRTANLTFTSHWLLADRTLSVHRDYVSKIAQPLCTGATRRETAAALKRISQDYNSQLSLLGAAETKSQRAAPAAATEAFNQGLSAAKQREFKKAEQLFAKALRAKLSPDQMFTVHVDRAWAYAMEGKYLPAVDDLSAAIHLKPDEARAYGMRASLYERLHQNAFAMADMNKVIELSSGNSAAHLARAQLAMELGKYATAVQDYTIALRFSPGNRGALEMRGLAYRETGDFDRAAQDLKQAIALRSENSMLPSYLCQALARSRNPIAAFAQCNAVLKTEPYSAIAYEARGYAHYRLKQYGPAASDFAAAARIYPNKAEYLFALGVAKKRLGDRNGGRQAIAQAQLLEPKIATAMMKWHLAP